MWTGDYGARLCVRLTSAEADELRQRAKDAGETVSDYVRRLIAESKEGNGNEAE